MKLEQIDNRLYKVSEVLPDELIKKILALDWDSFPYDTDTRLPNRKSIHLHGTTDLITQAEQHIHNLEKQVEEVCNIRFDRHDYINTSWWYDQPGFKIDLHTDGELASTLQLFLSAPGEQYGTKFYNTKHTADIRHDFPFISNTGYLMLNGQNSGGVRTMQWHGMLNPVPRNSYRLTCYTRFGTYTDK